jgi:hypothetical protein
MRNFPSRLWIWLSLIAAAAWVAVNVRDILHYDGTLTATVILTGFTALGAVIIIALGAVLRWYTDFVRNRRDPAEEAR